MATCPPPPLPQLSTPLQTFTAQKDDPVISEPFPLTSEVPDVLKRTPSLVHSNLVSFIHNVRPVLQRRRPMCGLVALSMASDLMYGTIKDSTEPLLVLEYAQKRSYTNQGEIFSSQHLLTMSQDLLNCTGDIIDSNKITPSLVLEWLTSNKAILIPYDCDKDHSPYLSSGHSAHWCILVGAVFNVTHVPFTFDRLKPYLITLENTANECYLFSQPSETCIRPIIDSLVDSLDFSNDFHVFTRHGKTRHLNLWKLKDLLLSCSNLKDFNPKKDPSDYVIPEGGIEKTLSSQVVMLSSR